MLASSAARTLAPELTGARSSTDSGGAQEGCAALTVAPRAGACVDPGPWSVPVLVLRARRLLLVLRPGHCARTATVTTDDTRRYSRRPRPPALGLPTLGRHQLRVGGSRHDGDLTAAMNPATLPAPAPRAGAGHHFWPYEDGEALVAGARRFLLDALERGNRALYAPRAPAQAAAPGIEHLRAEAGPEAVQIMAADELPAPDKRADPSTWPRGFVALTRTALEAGFSGLSVCADATTLVEAGDSGLFVRYEHLLGGVTRREPLNLLCAYEVARLDRDLAGQLAAVHDEGGSEFAPFHLHADGRVGLVLSGAIDAFSTAAFADVLELVDADGAPELVIDAAAVEFICHQALLALDAHAGRHGATVTLHACPAVVERIVTVLALERVRVDVSPS